MPKTLRRQLTVTIQGTTWAGYEAAYEKTVALEPGQRASAVAESMRKDGNFDGRCDIVGGYLRVTRGSWNGAQRIRTRYLRGY